ncbi:hypothetical protein COA09_19990 [Bacillus cereus]|nr:hypothetical protein COA09_19990 [Bacillus cereus]PGS43110.1 hypothetical protein COC67_31665 [Bacillus cereus]PGV09076.1 hypothetical protein COD77_15130 [Bacillus cereus]
MLTNIFLFFASFTKFEVLKALFIPLLAFTFNTMYSTYNALSPALNTGSEITVPLVWEQARFQIFGVIASFFAWIVYWLYFCFDLKTTILFSSSCLLFLAIIFVFQFLAGYWKRITGKKDIHL